MTKVLSYKGFDLSGDTPGSGFDADIPFDQGRALWSISPTIVARRNERGELTGAEITERPIPTQVTYDGALPYPRAWGQLLGALDPTEEFIPGEDPGTLVVDLRTPGDPDPLLAQARAIVTLPGGIPNGGLVNMIDVTFLTTDWAWRSIDAIASTPVTVDNAVYGGVTLDVETEAPVPLRVRLKPVAADNQVTVQTFTITNNALGPLENKPLRIDFGDTDDGLSHLTYYFALLREGKQQPISLQNYFGKQTYVWLIVDYLAPGETAEYMLLISDSYLMPNTGFVSYTQPAFDIKWAAGQANGGDHTTTLTNVAAGSGLGSEANRWNRGIIRALTGANAGLERRITGYTPGSAVSHAAFPVACTNGDKVLLTMSANGNWIYPVRATERNDNQRGMWWLNTGQSLPADWRFDVPGGFAPYLYYDNNDQFYQSSYTRINVGTLDSFAILNAWRIWEHGPEIGNDAKGGADGLTLMMPEGIAITSVVLDERLRNPNAMCKFFIGSRQLGSVGWIEEYVNQAATNAITYYASHTVPITADSHQIYLGLIPGDDADGNQKTEIGDDWESDTGTATIGDNGTATAGGASTLTDSSKSWTTNQWAGFTMIITGGTGFGQRMPIASNTGTAATITGTWGTNPDSTSQYSIARRNNLDDSSKNWKTNMWAGATARIIRGRGTGAAAVISANTPTQITAPFGVLIDNTSVYVIERKGLAAIVRSGDSFEVNWDTSLIDISTPTAPVAGFILDRDLFLDRATDTADPPYQRIRFTRDATNRYIVLVTGQELVIDGETQRAWIEDGSGNEVAAVPPRALVVQDVRADGTERLAGRWLEVSAGSHALMLSAVATGNDYEISAEYRAAYYG